MTDQYLQEIQQFFQLLQYGAWSAIIAAILMLVAIGLLLAVMGRLQAVEKSERYNSRMLQEIAKSMNIQQPPTYP